MKKIIFGTIFTVFALALVIVPAFAKAAKVDVCHVTDNGSYQLINVSENAQPAHLNHGDVLAGTGGLDANCAVVPVAPTRYTHTASFGSYGWAGWSCPLTEHAVGADVLVGSATTYLWGPGANVPGYTYPATPFGYNYVTGETGMIIQADVAGGNITYYVDCLPN